MKWSIFSLILFSTTTFFGQDISSPNWVIGGSLNFVVQKNGYPLQSFRSHVINNIGYGLFNASSAESRNISGFFQPYFAKRLNTNWSFGVGFSVGYSNYKSGVINAITSQPDFNNFRKSLDLGVEIFYRYVVNPKNKFTIFVQPYLSYASTKDTYKFELLADEIDRASFGQIGLALGCFYSFSKKFRVVANLGNAGFVGGTWKSEQFERKNKFSSFHFNFNPQSIRFGVEYLW